MAFSVLDLLAPVGVVDVDARGERGEETVIRLDLLAPDDVEEETMVELPLPLMAS